MKKKSALLALLLAGAMSFGVMATACSNDSSDDDDKTSATDSNKDPEKDPGKDPEVKPGDVAVESVQLNVYSLSLVVGDSATLKATVNPDNATDKLVKWSSSDSNVLTVDDSGNILAKGEGSATITAKAGGKSASCTVTVDPAGGAVVAVERVTLDKNQAGLEIGESLSLNAVVSPDGATNTTVTWSSSNSAVATVTNGQVTAKAAGTAVITATSNNGKSDSCTVTVYAAAVVNPAITYSAANNESIALEWGDSHADRATVSYREHGSSGDFIEVDKELIRQDDPTEARVDVLGLKGGVAYDVKIITSNNAELMAENMTVKAYDRSGYAHFKYSTGVGAYNDDGTLKDNAIVIYVTEQNKDYVMRDVVEKYAGKPGYEGLQMFKIPYYSGSSATTNWNKNADGIGWWLNNNQYTSSNAGSSKNKTPSNTYDPTNGGKLGFKAVNNPIVVRLVGEVTSPEGLTAYNSVGEGGGVGDNGHLARMKNLKNITIEGVGENACMRGWGLHFVKGTDATGEQGTSFEVRNIKFFEYPEDAVGMEGQQEGSKITASVGRCWIHHNTFLPGRCDSPAESDKKEGDGSCDFKRGMYLTVSYNWFEYCHKTNLVGSSDSSLQYNLTYHHNVWYQCGSRIPLTRQANVHFYNNYVWGDANEKSTPYSWIAKPSASYVHSLRANCYIYSEGNYYDGCKAVTDGKSGGECKGYNNILYACYGTNTIVAVNSREQVVDNKCAYDGVSYKTFDTDPNLFYYDSVNKKSDCYLTDAATARKECLTYSGVLKHDYNINTDITKVRPESALSVSQSGLSIDFTQFKSGGETVSGVKGINGKNNSGSFKGKGELLIFTLAERTDIKVACGTSGDAAAELLRVDGTLIAGKISTYVGTLEAGTYLITSGQKDKESSISELSFACGVTDAEKVQTVKGYIDAIGMVEFTEACLNKIQSARSAYNALSAALRSQVDNYSVLTSAENNYNNLAVAPVINLINQIGTVDANSGTKITAARSAYSKLTSAQQALVTNYSTLVEAEAAYVQYEVVGVNNAIAALAAADTATTEQEIEALLDSYNTVKDMYDVLDEDQKAEVINYSKVTDGIATLTAAIKPYDVRDAIAALPAKADVALSDSKQVASIRADYDALSNEGKAIVGDITKLTDAEEVIADLASKSVVAIFDKNHTDLYTEKGFTISGKTGWKGTSQTFTYDGTEYNSPLKMQSGTTVSFTLAAEMKVSIYLHGGGSQIIAVDGTEQSASGGVVTVTLGAGTHTLTKGSGEAWVCYVVVGA